MSSAAGRPVSCGCWISTGLDDPHAAAAPYDDPLIIVNYTIWDSIDALWAFTYEGQHLDMLRRRRDWFAPIGVAQHVLWWTPAGVIPPLEEAMARLEHLRAHGPTPHAFHFRQRFSPADVPALQADQTA